MKKPKKGEAVWILSDGTVRRFPRNSKPTLEELQKWVGGYIQQVNVRHEGQVRSMYINEEGKVNGLPRNETATDLFQQRILETGYGFPGDYIAGDAVVLVGYR